VLLLLLAAACWHKLLFRHSTLLLRLGVCVCNSRFRVSLAEIKLEMVCMMNRSSLVCCWQSCSSGIKLSRRKIKI
jgi:hypothetical protein